MRPSFVLLAGAAVYTAAVLWAADQLPPDGVPTHFDGTGRADAFGSRSAALGAYVVLGAVLLGTGIGLVGLARRGPLLHVKVPHRDHWCHPDRRATLRRMLAADAAVLMGGTVALLGLVPISTVIALRSDPVAVPGALLATILVLTVGFPIGWCLWLARYRYRPR